MGVEGEDRDQSTEGGLTIEVPATQHWDRNEPQPGIHALPIGSFMPAGAYRPMPITWLVAAWVVHNLAMILLVALLAGRPIFYTVGTTVLASLWIANKTFGAGMAQAATGWKVTLVIALLLNWSLAMLLAAGLAGY
jgi:hypothetical protein